ncbi:hypothetical protein D3C72_781180 [compost metagenome]
MINISPALDQMTIKQESRASIGDGVVITPTHQMTVKKEMTRPALARTAAILCSNPQFQRFLSHRFAALWLQHNTLHDKERAAAVVRDACGIQSRSELDSDTEARQRYNRLIGLPFSTWRDLPQNKAT